MNTLFFIKIYSKISSEVIWDLFYCHPGHNAERGLAAIPQKMQGIAYHGGLYGEKIY